jgi:hypothetical protein
MKVIQQIVQRFTIGTRRQSREDTVTDRRQPNVRVTEHALRHPFTLVPETLQIVMAGVLSRLASCLAATRISG